MQLSIALANGTLPITPATGYPAAVATQAASAAQLFMAGVLPTFISMAFTAAANGTDPQLTADGNQLQNDIFSQLRTDLPGFKIDTVTLTNSN